MSGEKSNNFTAENIKRLFDIIQYQTVNHPNEKSLNKFSHSEWISYSSHDLKNKINCLSAWFIENGFQKGDTFALVPKIGRPEWVIIDFACQQLGIVVVPIHPTAQSEEVQFILEETHTRLCVFSDKESLNRVISDSYREKVNIDFFHIEKKEKGYFEALDRNEISGDSVRILDSIKASILPDDLLTIMYTSGSSGVSKGAELTHNNLVSNVKAMLGLLPIKEYDPVISFLPFSHIFERTTCYVYMLIGVSIYFGQDKNSFAFDFNSVRPISCTAVPRILEKMYDFLLEERMRKKFIKKALVKWSMELAMRYDNNIDYKWVFRSKLFLARVLVLNSWRMALGGKIKYLFVGGAALRPEISRLFSAAGIKVMEGYGMTETSPLISFNRVKKGQNSYGTVGIPIENIKVKIENPNENGEGEIIVKGPNVFRGYYKRKDLTETVLSNDGWFKTGDIGKFIESKFLKITDRKKDIFKTSSGKYVAPQPLERHFCKSSFIQQCLVVGFQRPFVTAILVPNFAILKLWCDLNQIHWTSPQFMVHNIKVVEKIQSELDLLNSEVANHEKIRAFHLHFEEWTIEKGEYTPSFKPIRNVLAEKHHKEIDKMYVSKVISN